MILFNLMLKLHTKYMLRNGTLCQFGVWLVLGRSNDDDDRDDARWLLMILLVVE